VNKQIDARGLACPAPVMKTRGALRGGAREIEVLVDNATARDNVCRFASSQGCRVQVEEEGEVFRINISGPIEPGAATTSDEAPASPGAERKTVVVLPSDVMGRGEDELGHILIKAFLNTLAESETLPWRLVLFNQGCLLAIKGADTVEALKNLEELGVEILVCGTCLDYFGVKDKLAAGMVSNMYEIQSTMLMATNSLSV
jgi:selenium metabolism protein YedF